MVDAVGRGYVVQYCISLYRKKREKLQFQSYIADVLLSLHNHVAQFIQGHPIDVRYMDIVSPQKTDDRTGDDIAADIIKRAGLSFGGSANE